MHGRFVDHLVNEWAAHTSLAAPSRLPQCDLKHHLWDSPLLQVCEAGRPPVMEAEDEDHSKLNKIFMLYVVLTFLVMLAIKYLSEHNLVLFFITVPRVEQKRLQVIPVDEHGGSVQPGNDISLGKTRYWTH
ncbi:uncharacterized protein LOC121853133 [Homarus americanus]|uniref:uncharacterized protein LOC121853133 n=1 Tax=Homarus americanus TaxID=6706 RepID=UPI001C446BAD|nr:uncharacterized protein LOC121853133 [Homarus americanus]